VSFTTKIHVFGSNVAAELPVKGRRELTPSQKLTLSQVEHLLVSQRKQYRPIFRRPGLCTTASHEANLLPGFTPRRLQV